MDMIPESIVVICILYYAEYDIFFHISKGVDVLKNGKEGADIFSIYSEI